MPVRSKSSVVKVPKAGDLVAADLRRRIITGELHAGDSLPNEAALMEEFGVSRPTLREAFRILESESIITVLRGARGGARVVEPDGAVAARYTGLLLQYQGTPLVDVYRARTALEVSAVGILATGRDSVVLDSLDEIVSSGASAIGDFESFAQYDIRMHQALVDLAGNVTLGVLAGMLFSIIEAHNALFLATYSTRQEPTLNRTARRSHVKLVKLLRAGDAAAAQALWRKHLDAVEKYMVGDSDTTLVEVLS